MGVAVPIGRTRDVLPASPSATIPKGGRIPWSVGFTRSP